MHEITLAKAFLSSAKSGTVLYGIWKDRRRERDQRRLQQVQEFLQNRIDKLEEKIDEVAQSEDDCDLFMAVLNALIQDDEDQKVSYYAAFLEYFLAREKSDIPHRLIAEAIKTLTVAELEHLAIYETEKKRASQPPDWLKVRFPTRLQSLGLCENPSHATYGTRLTSIGILTQDIAKSVGG